VANETLYKYFIPYFTFRAAELLNTHLSCGAPLSSASAVQGRYSMSNCEHRQICAPTAF